MAHTQEGPVALSIRAKITEALAPTTLDIKNESHLHAHHEPMRGNTNPETHFKIMVVSESFTGKTLMQRHRILHGLLEHELQTGLHALVLKTKTPAEMEKETVQ
ncbi:bola-like protein-domain-containing protein [Spinellus fusiger]|nr:bola-like protein-domain-containing protein [Spinellus fusiger]